MKKFIVLLLAALMIVGLAVSCKEDPKPTFSFIGTWETSEETEHGIQVTTLEMKEDKTFSLDVTIEEVSVGTLTGTYEVKDGKLIATLDAESSAEYEEDEDITTSNPVYVFFKDTNIGEGPETALMGLLQTTDSIDTIIENHEIPGFGEFDLNETTLSIETVIENFLLSFEYTPDVFGEEVSKIDYYRMEGINDDSGNFLASMETTGHYDVSFVNKSFSYDTHDYYIFCKATKDNVSEVIMTSVYEEVDLTHFKAYLGDDGELTFTKK